jgi:eukaryotic-like serine/threonine-protein kinase
MPVASDVLLGRIIAGRYRVLRSIGVGGMGTVYEALHLGTEKRLALKVLAAQMSKDLKLVARFRREALAASRLEHPNCVRVDDFGEDDDGTFFIAMEFIDGHGLADELRSSGAMTGRRVAHIGLQLLDALEAAHSAGILHRDLKPQNVMLTQRPKADTVKVVDFGIAKLSLAGEAQLTTPGAVFGTPEYMSPEQARGDVLDARSDLYSAAVVLWHLLLGRSPFRGTSIRDTLVKVFTVQAASPLQERPQADIEPGLETVLRRALAKDPDQRFQDASAFASALVPFAGPQSNPRTRHAPGLPPPGQAPAATLIAFPAFPTATPAPGQTIVDVKPEIRQPNIPPEFEQPTVAAAPEFRRDTVPIPGLANQATLVRALPLPHATTDWSPPVKLVTTEAPVPTPSKAKPSQVGWWVLASVGFLVMVAVVVITVQQLGTHLARGSQQDGIAALAPAGPPPQPLCRGAKYADPTLTLQALEQARVAVKANDLLGAEVHFRKALCGDETSIEALAGVGLVATRLQHWSDARDAYAVLMGLGEAQRKEFGPHHARVSRFAAGQ